MPTDWIFHNGVWQSPSGGIIVPGGGGGGPAPGGTYGVAPRNGTLTDKSGLATQTTYYDGTDNRPNGWRFFGGFNNAANLTTWEIVQDRLADFETMNDMTNIRSGNDMTIRGGRFRGMLPEDGSTPWNERTAGEGHYHGDICIRFEKGLRGLIELVSVRNPGDALQIGAGGTLMGECDELVYRWNAFLGGGDDWVENDQKSTSYAHENLLSSFSGFSSRPGSGDSVGIAADASNHIYTMTRNLCYLCPKIFPNGASHPGNPWPASTPCVATFLKWQTTDSSKGQRAVLDGNILRYDETASISSHGIWGSLLASKIASSQGNVLLRPFASPNVGLPAGDWAALNPPGWEYLYGQEAKDYWDASVIAWCTAHPEVYVLDADKHLFGVGGPPPPAWKSAGNLMAGTGDRSIGYPSGYAANDIALLFAISAAENIAFVAGQSDGFVEGPGSGQSIGTAGAAGSIRLHWFWKRMTGSTGAVSPVLADPGSYVAGQMHLFTGCVTSGNPWNATPVGGTAASSTAVSVTGLTTTVDKCLIVVAVANAIDTTTAQVQSGSWANANLANVTLQANSNVTTGVGGGLSVATGEKTSAGATGASTATLLTTSQQAKICIALRAA